MKSSSIINIAVWWLPLTVVAFMGPSVRYVNTVFTVNTRWLALFCLLVPALVSRQHRLFRSPLFFLFLLYVFWCFLTVFWSDVLYLSLFKAIAVFLVIFILVTVSTSRVNQLPFSRIMDSFSLFALIALASAILGYFLSPNKYIRDLYQGFTVNPNMFGAQIAISGLWILWQMYNNRNNKSLKYFWFFIYVLSIVFLYLSRSRADMLIAACIGGFYLIAYYSHARQFRVILMVIIFIVGILLLINYEDVQESSFVRKTIYKDADTLLYTREVPWSESWDSAQKGGLWGVGIGVHVDSGDWKADLTSLGYGREKANTQLAIIEETGIVGFILYLFILIAIGRLLYRIFYQTNDRSYRVAIGLTAGGLSGLTVQSLFEAWWVAPGSMESVLFWTLVGMAMGLRERVIDERRQSQRPGGQIRPLPPTHFRSYGHRA